MAKRITPPGKILLVGTAAILFWRGAWRLMNLYIFPAHPLASYSISLIAGLVVLVASHTLADELL